jgi:hypothetical protein
MPSTAARYDGHAGWYDAWNRPNAERNAPDVRELLGPGDGLCLGLGCGSGLYFDILNGTGRTVVGVGRSAVQLRIARGRSPTVLAIGPANPAVSCPPGGTMPGTRRRRWNSDSFW